MTDFEKVYELKFEVRQAEAATRRLENGLEKLDKTTGKLQDGLHRVGKETKEAGDSFQRYMGKASVTSMNRLNRRVKATQVSLARVRTTVNGISRQLTIASAAFVGLGGVGIRNALELNKAMADVSTLLTGGIEQVRGLKTELQEMAKDTGKGTGDLAKGLYEVVSALGESEHNTKQLDQATRAAVAGRAETIEAVKMLSAVTKGYGDTSAEAMKTTSDFAFQTVKLGQTTFPELAASMGRVVPLAAALKTEQHELWGTMATLTGVTGNTAEVTTQLASIYSAVLKPTEQMTKAAKKAGFESASQMMKTIGLQKSLLVLNDAVDGNEDKLAKLLKRKEALVAVLALLGGQSEEYERKLKLMKGAAGATDEAFRKQTEGINKQGHEWEKTKQRMIVFSQRLGDKLLPVLGRLLDKLEPVLEYIEKMDEETMDSWIAFGKWMVILAGATKALSGFLGIVEGLGTLRALTTGLQGVSGELVGIQGQAKATGALLTAMKVTGAAAALGLGWAIGNMLNDIWFAPAAKRRERERAGLEEAGYQARTGEITTGTLEEQEQALAELRHRREEFRKGAGAAGPEDIAGALAAMVSDVESPGERRGRAYEEFRKGEAALQRSIAEKATQRRFELEQEYGISAEISRPGKLQGGQTIQMGDTHITVNAPSGDAPQILRQVEQTLRRRDRDLAAEIRKATREVAPAEQ